MILNLKLTGNSSQQFVLESPVPKKSNDEEVVDRLDRIAKLEYVEQMLRELRRLAGSLEADTLTYLLEMSALEAADTLKAKRLEKTMHSGGD